MNHRDAAVIGDQDSAQEFRTVPRSVVAGLALAFVSSILAIVYAVVAVKGVIGG